MLLLTRPGPKGGAAIERVRTAATGPAPVRVSGDLSSLADVRRLADAVLASTPSLQLLIHNAGIVSPERQTTVDGHELQFAVNHLAVYLLTHQLLPALRVADRARIVVTASQVERSGTLDFRDLMSGANYRMDQAYSRSKLANVLFTYELATRLAGSGITTNCLHPGVVRTNLLNRLLGEGETLGPAARIKGAVGGVLRRAGLKAPVSDWALTPDQGAATTLFVATAPELEGVTGQYFSVGARAESSPQSRDSALGRELWRISASLTGVNPDWP